MIHFQRLDAQFGCGGDSNTYECAICRSECDSYDEELIKLDGEDVCPGCREMCDGGCGEWLTDETLASCGPIVNFRDWALNGKLQKAHASCAAETMLSYMDSDFSYDHSTREEIAATVASHFARVVTT